VAPLAPQAEFVSLLSGRHVLPLQHPWHARFPQVQAPTLEHAWPVAQAPHEAPFVPHWPAP
jgi:hypothetical protein